MYNLSMSAPHHTSTTDPARELADICQWLHHKSDAAGFEFLAESFGVNAWSREFHQVVFCILDRADFLKKIVAELDHDEDYKSEAANHIDEFKLAFTHAGFANAWSQYGLTKVGPLNAQPLKKLSASVRREVSYPKLSDDEISKLLVDVAELESWLMEHQLAENDFIRQALIDGLASFRFRLERLGWLGWGYTTKSLRDVIAAYFALERTVPTATTSPDAEAMLRKVGGALEQIFLKAKVVKDVVAVGDVMIRAYGALSLVWHHTPVAGYLTHQV